MTYEDDSGRFWPVVAEFFVSILAVFVVLIAAVSQPPAVAPATLDGVRTRLEQLSSGGLLDEFEASDREILMVYSTKYLGFEACSWTLDPARALEVQESVKTLEAVAKQISRLSIEGHADERPARCDKLRFGTNFELSQNRAMAVFAAMLGEPIEKLDEVVKRARDSAPTAPSQDLVWTLTGSQRVVVAGFGATRPRVPNDPEHEHNRRVELRAVLGRER